MEPLNRDAFFRQLGEEEERLRGRFYAYPALVGLILLVWRHFLSGDPDAFWFGPLCFMLFFFILPRLLFHTMVRSWLDRRQFRKTREHGFSREELQEAIAPWRDLLGLADERNIPPGKALVITVAAVLALILFLLVVVGLRHLFPG